MYIRDLFSHLQMALCILKHWSLYALQVLTRMHIHIHAHTRTYINTRMHMYYCRRRTAYRLLRRQSQQEQLLQVVKPRKQLPEETRY